MTRIVLLLALCAAATGVAHAATRSVVTFHGSAYGRVVFDGRGFVLYAFTRDRAGRSSCIDACAAAWPPYIVRTRPHGPRLGAIKRKDGRLQVTYVGRPVYYYVGDRKPGQILCQNVFEYGGRWLVLRPNGTLVR